MEQWQPRRMNQQRVVQRSRREQIARVRTRLAKITPEDRDMLALINVIKGLIDVVADDGGDDE